MPEERRLVTILFADVVGSTAFGADNDPEVVRSVMSGYFERMKSVAELHGGTVEKFIGDAVMVVFGVPRIHDDDAERAVRAALAMREEVAALDRELEVDLAVRIGVNTGHAVASTSAEKQFLVTGDAVNLAARLQQGAEPGEVLVGSVTEQLTRAAIEYAPHEAVAAKGKAEPIPTFAGLRARSAVPEQARGLPSMRAQLVGRQRELRALLDVFDRVRDERRVHVFTVVGNAGVGKSRLVGEALARMSAAGATHVLRGRCLPYGAGITYWPLIEIVRADTGISSDDDRAAALTKLRERVAGIFPASEARGATARLSVLLGLEGPSSALPEIAADSVARELAWAARRYLEGVAREPAIVAVDDLQWAETPLLELIDGMADFASDVPLLLLCIARPQLLEARPAWGATSGNATRITLSPLDPEETSTLIGRLLDIDDLPADLRGRIVDRSGGNPLFCEEFIRMLLDEGRIERVGGRWRAKATVADVRVPESIEALIAARLDGLAQAEKAALQVASVIGETFAASQAIALADQPSAGEALEAARRKDLLVRERSEAGGEDLRFKHLLIREVAYESLPKATRAALHERFGDQLSAQVGDRRDEYAEILGHHAERAFSLSAELRLPRDVVRTRARRVLAHALSLAERGRDRQDSALLRYAAVARAAADALGDELGAEDNVRVAIVAAEALSLAGSYPEAIDAYRRAAELASASGLTRLEGQARLGAVSALVWTGSGIEQFDRELEAARRAFSAASDARGLLETDLVKLELWWVMGRFRPMLTEGQQLIERARQLGDRAMEMRITGRLYPAANIMGARDAADRLRAAAEQIAEELGLRSPRWLRFSRCKTRLIEDDDLEAAEACFRQVIAVARAEGEAQMIVGGLRNLGEVLLWVGRHDDAAPLIDEALERSIKMGERWSRAELIASQALVALGRGDLAEADRLAQAAREAIQEGDVFADIRTGLVAAHVAAARGRLDEALAAFRAQAPKIRETDFAADFLDLLVAFAEHLTEHELPGADEVIAVADQILERTGVRYTRARLNALRRTPAR